VKTGKIIIVAILGLLLSNLGFAQSRDESGFSSGNNEQARLVQFYPNPATEYLSVKFEAPCADKIRMTLHNILGNIIEVETEVLDHYELRLKVKDLPSGYYLLAFKDSETNFKSTYKFLKR
jgi:hypothetical protein